MKKFTLSIIIAVSAISMNVSAQVGINTPNPHAPLQFKNDIVSRKIVLYETGNNDNQFYGFGVNGGILRYQTDTSSSDHVFYSGTNATTSYELMRIKGTGNVGIGTSAPTSQLHTTGTVRFQNYPSYGILATDAGGNLISGSSALDNLGIPRPAVYELSTGISDFLNGIGAGGNQAVPMTEVANYTGPNGVTYNPATSTITFQPGLYQMTFVYAAVHNNTGCNLSSHILDFPTGGGGTQRVHSTASHVEGSNGIYGGNISYTTKLTVPTTWVISLGRGISGNCYGTGNSLISKSTQLSILRLGN